MSHLLTLAEIPEDNSFGHVVSHHWIIDDTTADEIRTRVGDALSAESIMSRAASAAAAETMVIIPSS